MRLRDLAQGGRTNPQEAVLCAGGTAFDDASTHETPRCRRRDLLTDDAVTGPAILVQRNSTTLVPPPGFRAIALAHGDVLIARA